MRLLRRITLLAAGAAYRGPAFLQHVCALRGNGHSRKKAPRVAALTVCSVLSCWILVGCEEDVVTVLGTDRAYSLYGVLSPQLDSQWVRVFPVENRLEPEAHKELDAEFVSTDLQTGEEHRWRDSVIIDAFGQRAHVFWAPFVAAYDREYRLRVRRSDGAETSVTVEIPPQTDMVLQEANVTSTSVVMPVLIEGGAPRLLQVEVVYGVGYRPAGLANPASDEVVVPYPERANATAGGWVVPVNLDEDYHAVRDSLERRIERPVDRDFGILLNLVSLRLIVANDEWNPPDGIFDADVLVQPGTLSNVMNGFGFVGGGYRQELEWTPPGDVSRAAGFRASME